MTTIYEFSVTNIRGELVDWARYRGRVLLLVNVASRCGFTPQYEGLEQLQKKYGDIGFSVLGLPCNDFGGQEPGTEKVIEEFCERRFDVSFDLLAKVKIIGKEGHPLYRWLMDARLKAKSPQTFKARVFTWLQKILALVRRKPAPEETEVTWNFHKFLIDKSGHPVDHFASAMEPLDEAVTLRIEEELSRKEND